MCVRLKSMSPTRARTSGTACTVPKPRTASARTLLGMLPITVLLISIFGVRVFGGNPPGSGPVHLVQSIPIPATGRIDHMAIDVGRQRLFVAALGSNQVLVLNLRTGQLLQTIDNFAAPQGVYFVQQTNRLFVSNSGDGTCVVLDGASYRRLAVTNFRADADNIRYDADANQIYVGFGSGGLGVLDGESGSLERQIPLSSHPEAFELELDSRRVFVNLPQNGSIVVTDRDAGPSTESWKVEGAAENYPMALDAARHQLYVGCRRPTTILIYDTHTGRPIANAPVHGDLDDLYYDAARRRLYAACGAGFLDVIESKGPRNFVRTASIPTAQGARTALYVPVLARLYLAVPARGAQKAEVRVYQVLP